MIDLTFLSAAIPLTKAIAYNKHEQAYSTKPYPMVQKVSTHVERVDDLTAFHTALAAHAAQGHALLKGRVARPLVNESRAGLHLDEPTQWLVLDFDKVNFAPTHEGALAALGHYIPQLAHVDCLIQLSASCFVPTARKLSMHVYVLLEEPVDPNRARDWLTFMNFQPQLIGELRLSNSLHVLSYPLDRMVASPARILYIAPPRCIGFTSPVERAMFLVRGARSRFRLPEFAAIDSSVISAKINELRRAANLPERTFVTRLHNGIELLDECDECTVHDIRPSGEGYLQFNMNGGDSRGYWINLRQPHIIGNFKGDPFLRTEQAAPELFKQLVRQSHALPPTIPPASIEPLAFYATNRQSSVFIGSYDRENDALRIEPSTREAASAWMARFGVYVKQLPHYDLEFNMQSKIRFEEGYPIINLFAQTPYLKQHASYTTRELASVEPFDKACPTIWKTIWSVVGSNPTAAEYFVNWVAALFQRCAMNKSAWVFHGVQGTGKGMLVHYILRPLFGEPCVTQQLYTVLNTGFNGYLEGKLLVVYDEAELGRSHDWSEMMSKLKDWITDPIISIIDKNKSARDAKNTANFIFCTNGSRPVVIEDSDRRFNVGDYQRQRLLYTPNEYAALADGRELDAFAQLLGKWSVNDEWLLHPYAGDSKRNMYESTHSLLDQVGRAIQEGDLEFFIDNRPSDVVLRTEHATKILPVREYDALIAHAAQDQLSVLTPDDLYALFRIVALGDKTFPETPAQQRRIYKRYNLLAERNDVRVDKRTGKKVRGIRSPVWRLDEVTKDKAAPYIAGEQQKLRAIK